MSSSNRTNPEQDVSPPPGVFMNSSVNPSSELPNLTSDQAQTDELAGLNRLQPIPPPSEPLQYRAIGLVRGCYKASVEQFTQGTLLASDGTEINAVLLGRIMSLLKNHLDLEQEHLWVVYPRSGQQDGNLHLQIVGVWEPEKLSKQLPATTSLSTEERRAASSTEIEDGYFSVRGEVIYQSVAEGHFVVKIRQAPRKESESPKYFKLKIQGDLAIKAVGKFWDLQVKRQADTLVLQAGVPIAALPSKPRLKKNKPRPTGHTSPIRNLDTPRPVRQAGDAMSVKRPIPKPASSSRPT
ncbi:MAG: hypothetical protein JO235_18330, partial [Chroococcidiopsidaceae cyanobacterium CP_BM_RX_35]|nr:hypothetical protein [Chroococcidiopsidaceae cyanobacterium CP_BM_RX_35]